MSIKSIIIILGITFSIQLTEANSFRWYIYGYQRTSTSKNILQKDTSRSTKINYGKYNFTFTGIEGRKYALSQFGGKIVLVNIWAPWCEPCKKETEGFVRLYNRYHSKGFEILGIAVQTTLTDVQSFINDRNVTYPIGIKDDINKLYKTIGIPSSYLFGPDGKLIKEFVGYTDEKRLQLILDETLKKFRK